MIPMAESLVEMVVTILGKSPTMIIMSIMTNIMATMSIMKTEMEIIPRLDMMVTNINSKSMTTENILTLNKLKNPVTKMTMMTLEMLIF